MVGWRWGRRAARHPEHLLLGEALFAVEVPEQLVVPVGQGHVAGVAVAVAVQCQRAGCGNGAVTGRRPRLDLPGHRLAGVKAEGIEVERTHVWLVAPVSHWRRGT